MKLNVIYEMAADVIVRNGHHKGFFYTHKPEYATSAPSVCLVGAVCLVMTGNPVPPKDLGVELGDALLALSRRVESNVDDFDFIERIADWNDAEDRTPAEVVDLLLNAAKQVAA